jgi:hypothetical protein
METMRKAVQTTVNDIYKESGEVKPSDLLERAEPKTSPIHDAFEWDNKKAGHEYRLIQARTWIRKVDIVFEDRTERLVHVPLLSIEGNAEPDNGEGYYKPISVVQGDYDEFKRAKSAVLARLNSAKNAYEELKRYDSTKAVDYKLADKGFDMVHRGIAGVRA